MYAWWSQIPSKRTAPVFNNVLRVTLASVAVIGASACSPVPDVQPSVTSPVPARVVGSMTVPPPWSFPATDGTCTAELRTTPFDAESAVTLEGIRGDARWTVSETDLGTGALRNGACAFSVSLDVPGEDAAEKYRLTVESSTRSLQVTWDYPPEVVRSGAPLAMPLTDKVLVY